MDVDISNAITEIYGLHTSFDMVYNEAVSNALDANANNISITIEADSPNDIENLKLTISDDGEGFDDKRYTKFGILFNRNDPSHKGAGRLVFLAYFDSVKIESYYEKTKCRTIHFKDDFEKDRDFEIREVDDHDSGSTLVMQGYKKTKLRTNNYLSLPFIKKQLIECFCFTLYDALKNGRIIEISLKSIIGGICKEDRIINKELPELQTKHIETKIDLFSKVDLLYMMEEVDNIKDRMIKSAIIIDGRSYPFKDVFEESALPFRYRMLFLLSSNYFTGKTDSARLRLNFNDEEKLLIQKIFRSSISDVISEHFPHIKKANEEKLEQLNDVYPHLRGYIDTTSVGFINPRDVLQNAEKKYIFDQREILNAKSLTEEQYEKSIDIASRSLMQYILFRQRVIEKLKTIDKKSKEKDIHSTIIPMKKIFMGKEVNKDLYRNNVWVLDDKFMTYSTILSDMQMTQVINIITEGEDYKKDEDRPDIALIFSNDPSSSENAFDVVIVELKKKGLNVEQTSIVEVQLESRARKLSKYYNNRIQRIWYYGIVECMEEYQLHLLSNEYKQLFSHGKIYCRSKNIAISTEPYTTVIANIFIMDIDAVVLDADSRNTTFMNLLKKEFAPQT